MNKVKNYFKVWFIPLMLVIIMAGCEDRNALLYPPSVSTPTVSATNPVDLTINVPLNQKITAAFSEAMDSSTITSASFTLMQGTVFVSGTVSYTGTIATFSPTSNLDANTPYIATITTMAKNPAGVALAKNFVWIFTTGVGVAITPPTITSTDPANAATGIPINQKIAATFSVGMDASTITTSTFSLLLGTTSVSGFVSYSGTTALFAPASNLLPNTAYTVTITNSVKDLAGNKMTNNYVWSFTTGATAVVTPPTVTTTDPTNNETGVGINQKIIATFSKTMDATTITASTFTLKQGTTSVSGFVSYSGTTAILAPASNLSSNTIYTVTITTGAKDLTGNALTNNYEWTFTTGLAVVLTPPTIIFVDPANGATAVPINQKIAATFSVTMDAATITTSTFTLVQGTTQVPGSVSYAGTIAIFAPTSDLTANTAYTAMITTGAMNLAGTALVNNYEWSFTTGATVVVTPPSISFTNPTNLETGVALNQKIAATFTKTMDATTITTATFTLQQGITSVSGLVSYTGKTATFAPNSDLAPNTLFTATVTTGAKDLAGNALASNYVWSFTTGAAVVIVPPTVISTDPVNVATGVALSKKIAVTFSKSMDATTITTSTIILKQGTNIVPGLVTSLGTLATYTPGSNLLPNSTYSVTITTGVRDLTGNSMTNDYVWSFTTGAGTGGQVIVNLGSAARFAILSNSAITNIPSSSITGDVGISPGARSSIQGLTNPEVVGTIFAADDADPVPAMLIAAKTAAETAYLDAVAAVRGTPTPISGNINGLTLVPGLYQSGTSIEISPGGMLYLDGQGDANAVFVIRSATSITTESTSQVILTNGANAKNIFWVAGTAVTLGTNSKMKGTIIASSSISLLTGARLDGRALIQGAAAGQVSLDQCTIVLP